MVIDTGTPGCRGITSSLYLNWNISVIYCRIEIKIVPVKAEPQNDDDFYFVKNTFYFRSNKHDVIKLSIWTISLIIRWILSQTGQGDLDNPYNL